MNGIPLNNLAWQYMTVPVTITSTAQSLIEMINAAVIAAGYTTAAILQVTIMSHTTAGAERAAVLFGGVLSQDGYLIAGNERSFPVLDGKIYVKRAGGSDFAAVIEVFLRYAQ